MAGTYFIGFPVGTPEDDMITDAIAAIRNEGDKDSITAGPTIIIPPDPDPDDDELPHPQVRIVTGLIDPRMLAEASAEAEDMERQRVADTKKERLAAIRPEHLAALNELAALLSTGGSGSL